VGEEIYEKQKDMWTFSSMPELNVSDKIQFENFIRMSWDDFEELFAVVEPMIVVLYRSPISTKTTRYELWPTCPPTRQS